MGRRSLLDRVIAACVVISQIAIPLPAHAGPMDLEGQFSVSESGAATYNIPLVLPPGTGGMEPKLALAYSSQGGNGLLGVGWSLSGLSAITRCPRTLAQDGTRGAVNFDSNDRFCLDGQRLMLASGTYGANGAEYRTERDAFSKIVSYGTAGNGPAWFKVWTKSGQILEYGNTADALIEAQAKTSARAWALNKASDTKGNYFTVTYTEDTANGDFYPAQIDYTGNASASLAPNAAVKFVYEIRPDTSSGYYLGSLLNNTQRLKTIQATLGGTTLREYRLTYQAGTTGRSRLASIAECEMAASTCKSPITLGWSDLASGFAAGAGWGSMTPSFMVDVNGDGLTDLVTVGSDGLYVALATATGVGASTKWIGRFGTSQGHSDGNLNPIMMVDVNSDGLADAVGFANDGVYVALSTGSSFGTPTRWSPEFGASTGGYTNMDVNPRTIVDVNGDGRPDIVGFKADGVYVALNNGSNTYFNSATNWLSAFGTATSPAYATSSAHPRMLADVNGDGIPDVVGFSPNGVYVALGTGSGFSTPTLWNSEFTVATGWTTQDTYPRTLADVNGDGQPDIVGFKSDGVYVSLNTGTTFQASTKWLSDFGTATATAYTTQKAFPRYLADVNGDGRADIVGFAANGVQVAISSGSGFAAATQWVAGYGSAAGYTTGTVRQLADLDGDGVLDVVGVKSTGVTVSPSAKMVPPDVLLTITSGLGATITADYKPLTANGVHVKSGGSAYPVIDLATPMTVVSSVKNPNGLGSAYTTTNYKYGGLKADISGRGSLGMAWVEATQVEANVATRTYLRQDWPYTGLPERVLTSVPGASGFLGLVTNTYACIDTQYGGGCSVSPGRRYFPYLSQRIETPWDLNGAALPVVTTNNTYDTYGNVTQIVRSVNDGTSSTTTNTYTNDAVSWILGRLTRAQVSATTGGTPTNTSNGLFTFNATISSSTSNYNLKSAAIAAGWDQISLLMANVTIASGVVVTSGSTTTAAFDVGTGIPPGSRITVVNNGSIIGRGGNGAGGANVSNSTFNGTPATDGGPGFQATLPVTLTNNGTIAGGGGGGGAGNGYRANVPWPVGSVNKQTAYAGSSGGGGGAGGGAGGSAGYASGVSLLVSGLAGTAGTTTAAGVGGGTATCWQYATLKANTGGAGGALGQPGVAGSSAYSAATIPGAVQFGGVATPAGPGAAGPAVKGSAHITWLANGTRLGPLQ